MMGMGTSFRTLGALLAIAASGCASHDEPGRGGSTLPCKENLDCSSLGSDATCVSGTCKVPFGIGGGMSGGGPPAQGAVVESISATPGGSGCVATSAPFAAPTG